MTDSPGTVIIVMHQIWGVKGQRSTDLGLKCSFGAIYGATNVVLVLKLDWKDLNSEAKHICCNSQDQIWEKVNALGISC